MQDYCEAVSRYPGSVVERAVDRFINGAVEGVSKDYAPSIARLNAELRRTGMNEPERQRFFALNRKSPAIEGQPKVIALAQAEAKRRASE